MGWLIVLGLIVGAVVLYVRSSSKKAEPPRPVQRQPRPPLPTAPGSTRAAEEAWIRREIEAEAARMQPEIDARAARMRPEIEVEAARIEAEAREAAAAAFEELEDPVEEPRRVVWREDYVPKEEEGRYLTRKAGGLPNLTSPTPATGWRSGRRLTVGDSSTRRGQDSATSGCTRRMPGERSTTSAPTGPPI